MPRPNRDRSLENEQNLAKRIAIEREERGMTYEGLARRMSDVGCATHASALYKVEKGNPPRRVTVSELIALSAVFETPIESLLMPPEVRNAEEARRLLHSLAENLSELSSQTRSIATNIEKLRKIAVESPDLGLVLADLYSSKPWLTAELGDISDELRGAYEDFTELATWQIEASDS